MEGSLVKKILKGDKHDESGIEVPTKKAKKRDTTFFSSSLMCLCQRGKHVEVRL